MWKGLKRRLSFTKKEKSSTGALIDDPFFTMGGVQYKTFDPDCTQVYGMYHKDDQEVPEKEEQEETKDLSPVKQFEEMEQQE